MSPDLANSSKYREILDSIERIRIIDTHEHIGDRGLGREEDAVYSLDYLYCTPYISNRLISSGLDPAVFQTRMADPDRFRQVILDNLDSIRATCQYQNLARGFLDLYEFPEDKLTLDTWEDLNSRILKAYEQGYRGWCRTVFQRAQIAVALKNVHLPYYTRFVPSLSEKDRVLEERLFYTLPHFDWVLFGYEREKDRTKVLVPTQESLGFYPKNFDEYLELVARFVTAAKGYGAVGLKATAAYFRLLDFAIVRRSDARQVYEKNPNRLSPEEEKTFQDYLMMEVVRLAGENELPIHFHTGAIFGTKMNLSGLAPSKVCRLLSWPEARNTTFVLLHGGIPYTSEMTAMVKTFPNAMVDYSDVGMVSYDTLKRCLHEWIECVPSNKIVQGGDALNIEQCYGVIVRQKEALAEVLAEKVEARQLSMRLARKIAQQILRENPKRIFKIPETG
jgi:hypothetical protein